MANPWDGIVSADEIAAYEAAGFGRPQGMGKRPALLIIDVQYRTIGTQRQPFWEAIKEFKTACGEVGWRAVDHIQPLLALFRELKLPVIYPYVSPKEAFDVGRLAEKVPALMKVAANGYQFVPEVAPREQDILLPKNIPARSSARRWSATWSTWASTVWLSPDAPRAAACAAASSMALPTTSAARFPSNASTTAAPPATRSTCSTWRPSMRMSNRWPR